MKPRILSFIYSTGFKADGEVGDAIGILNTIRLDLLPNRFSFFIIAIIQGIDSEVTNKLKIEFQNIEQEKILFATDSIEIPAFTDKPENPLPKEAHILNFQLDFRNVNFEKQGWHKTVVIFNDEIIHEANIFVYGKSSEQK